MRRTRGALWSVSLLLGTSVVGCGDAPPRTIRRGPLPLGCLPADYDAGPGCTLRDGRLCPANASCPAADTCNSCYCVEQADGGRVARCTIEGCPARARACTEVSAWDCQLPSGRWCRGSTCTADDACNVCACQPDGTLVCTTRACVDAGVPACHGPDECPQGSACVAPAAGCDQPLRCVRADAAAALARWACLCDGTTAWLPAQPDAPFAFFGPCPGYRSEIGAPCTTDADCAAGMLCDSTAGCTQRCSGVPGDCPPDSYCALDPEGRATTCRRP